MSSEPPPQWAAFLKELDSLLDEPVELHCIGGFAAVAAYGLPRSTNDLVPPAKRHRLTRPSLLPTQIYVTLR